MQFTQVENEFHTMLKDLSDVVLKASETYLSVMSTFPESRESIQALSEIETAGDLQTQKVMERLRNSLNAPLDKQDIAALAHNLDDIIDQMNGMAVRLDLFNRVDIIPEAKTLATISHKMCEEIQTMIYLLPDVARNRGVMEIALEIGDIEDLGDETYQAGLYRLFHEEISDTDRFAWVRLLDRMEYVLDACNGVARVVKDIVMKQR